MARCGPKTKLLSTFFQLILISLYFPLFFVGDIWFCFGATPSPMLRADSYAALRFPCWWAQQARWEAGDNPGSAAVPSLARYLCFFFEIHLSLKLNSDHVLAIFSLETLFLVQRNSRAGRALALHMASPFGIPWHPI